LGNGDGEEIPPVNKPKDDGGFADSNANEGGNYDDYSSYDDSYKPIEEPLYPYDGGDVKVSFNLKRYNVVIGTFRNSTNAKALKERMQRDGYVVDFARNDKGLIRVIVKSTDNRAEALKERAKVRSKYYPNFQDTWVLKRY
jgi:cell division protein FtsN